MTVTNTAPIAGGTRTTNGDCARSRSWVGWLSG